MKRLFAFLFMLALVGLAALLIHSRRHTAPGTAACSTAPTPAADGFHEAMWYETLANNLVHCHLCPNACRIPDGKIGLCRVRKNIGGRLVSLSYGQLAAVHVDPVEKKPFYHVLPGTKALSLATPGCNMRCLFCQNWEISQAFPWEVTTTATTPEEVVEAALRNGCSSIAFTYSEPTIFYEYMLAIARLAKAKGLKTLVVSNGFINPGPLKELLPFIDAYKVDFKAFNPDFYTHLTGGRLEPVLQAMKIIQEQGVWLEIVTLLVTGQNDSEDEVRELARWIKENLGTGVPLHFSRFHPTHKLANLPPTPIETVIRARDIALGEGLSFVYTGNIPYRPGDSTYSPKTGKPVIERKGYFVVRNGLAAGVTPEGERIPGIWR